MERNMLQEHLRQAERHIALGARHIARQRELVAELERDGHDASTAAQLLSLFEEVQLLHLADRSRMQRALPSSLHGQDTPERSCPLACRELHADLFQPLPLDRVAASG